MDSRLSISVLGSTGSIGTQTLEVVRSHPDRLKVVALTAGKNISLLLQQIAEFKPSIVGIAEERDAVELRASLPQSIRVCVGEDALEVAASDGLVDLVVVAVVGFAGLLPVLSALKAGKNIALANKESLVSAGSLVNAVLSTSKGRIYPVDSEHSSIFQCLMRRGLAETPRRIILTASGGPFLDLPREEFEHVTVEAAIKHPRWQMGSKISVDSATLMNKGLEVIEASVLFQLPAESIEVLVHPESVVHGLVEYQDSSVVAAMFPADMRIPITFAIESAIAQQKFDLQPAEKGRAGEGSLGVGMRSGANYLDLAAWGKLTFRAPDYTRFPCLQLAYHALRLGQYAPAVLNAANEVAVSRFLAEDIKFTEIPRLVADSLVSLEEGKCQAAASVDRTVARQDISSSIEQLYSVNEWGRAFAADWRC